MRVIIAGSRSISDYRAVESAVEASKLAPTRILSGGASGDDGLGGEWAVRNGVDLQVYKADWKLFRSRAGRFRNLQMVLKADALIAVWDGASTGTAHMIESALASNLLVFVSIVGIGSKWLNTQGEE